MRKINIITIFLLIICMVNSVAFGQNDERLELDASSLRAGDPLQFQVRIDSLEQLSFGEAKTRLTAILCPVGADSGSCEIMYLTPGSDDNASINAVFTLDQLPAAGDYSLDVSFLDETGTFETTTASYILRGVGEAEQVTDPETEQPSETPDSPNESTAETEAVSETPDSPNESTAEPEVVSETPSDELLIAPSDEPIGEGAEAVETAAPEMPEDVIGIPGNEETPEPEETEIPLTVTKAMLRPEIRDQAGSTLIYGSTTYVNDAYTLQLTFDRPLNDSVILEASLPVSLMSAPIDPASECMVYLNSDGTAWEFPGGLWTSGTFSCGIRFSDSAWIAAQPVEFTLKQAPAAVPGLTETFEMDKLSWTNYPVNITKHPATHQMMVSDSRGNLICSDNAPCARFNAEDVYILTYQFPASWSAAQPSGLDLSASIIWPEAWADALSNSSDVSLAAMYGTACTVDWEGKSTLSLEETAPGRYSASCTFVPSGLSNPLQAAAQIHLNDNSFAVNDLNVWMPATIIKTEAVITPSLTLRMTDNSAAEEQIRGGTIGTLYRTSRDYPNSFNGSGAPALYTLKAEISGISSVRAPQFGDHVVVRWALLDSLAMTGDLPFCLVPDGDGYTLGNLEQSPDGTWRAQCDFRFPQTLDESVNGTPMEMQLLSGVYQTSAKVQMNGSPFKKDTIYVDLDVPEHMLLGQPTDFHVRLSDSSGGFSDYLRAVLEAEGVSLNSSWNYNYLTTCGGNYTMGVDGTSECSVYFTQPVTENSEMHFDLITSAAEHLFDVVYRPSADIHVLPITNIKAYLSVRLFHAGEEISLPASDDDVFMVGDDYQLKFYLTPDPEFRDVLNAVSVDYEGMVLDWFEPLLIRWDAIPYGQTGLNFYRDGESFVASYDFSFSQGNLFLDGNMGRLVMEPAISGWDVEVQGGLEPIRLPSHVERKPLSLEISEFTVIGNSDPVSDLFVEQEADFTIKFNGNLDSFDPLQLMVGYDANGIHTPISCAPDYSDGVLRCSLIAQCTDYMTGGNYSSVCGTNLSLYAVYNGDTVNQAAEAAPKTFNVKRQTLRMTPVTEGSISAADVRNVQAVSEDLQWMGTGSLSIGGWPVNNYIPRQIRSRTAQDYCSYPVIFRFDPLTSGSLEEASMRLDIAITTGSRSNPQEDTISIRPSMLTNDMVMFSLDFGSLEMLDDGRIVKDVLDDAVEIRSLKAHYHGSPLISEASCTFEAPELEFALKVATVIETNLDLSLPGLMSFGGLFAGEAIMQPFDIYCSQLYQDLQCSTQPPAEVVSYDFSVAPTETPVIAEEDFSAGTFLNDSSEESAEAWENSVVSEQNEADETFVWNDTSVSDNTNETSEPSAWIDPNAASAWNETNNAFDDSSAFSDFMGTGSVSLDFKDEGCWGKIKTSVFGVPQIYVNNAVDPVCYLTAWNENRQIWIVTNGEL